MACVFDVERAAFERALSGPQNIAQKRTPTPILANVRIDAEADGNLRLFATDYDVGLTCSLSANVQSPGAAALPARMLYDIVKRSPGERITIDVSEAHHGEVKTGGRGRYKIHGIDPADFPEPHTVKAKHKLSVDRHLWALWLKKTLFAASTDESRAALAGVFLEFCNGTDLRFVATDTHRLALQTVEKVAREGMVPADGIILPRKALQELLRLVDGDGELTFAVEMPHICVTWGSSTFVFRTVDGRFPSYRTVIPEQSSRIALIERKPFIEAIERVTVILADRFKCVTLGFSEGVLRLMAKSPETGEAEEIVDCEYKGDSIAVGFNAQYLTDALEQVTTDRVELRLIDDVSPTLLTGEGDASYQNVIMPMRI